MPEEQDANQRIRILKMAARRGAKLAQRNAKKAASRRGAGHAKT